MYEHDHSHQLYYIFQSIQQSHDFFAFSKHEINQEKFESGVKKRINIMHALDKATKCRATYV